MLLEVLGDVGEAASDEVSKNLLIRSRDEEMGGVVVGRENVLRVREIGSVGSSRGRTENGGEPR